MIKFILDVLPHVKEGKYVEIAKGKHKLPTTWSEFTWQIKNVKKSIIIKVKKIISEGDIEIL